MRGLDQYVLQYIAFCEGGGNETFVGYIDDYILYCPDTGITYEDILGIDELDDGTSTGSNTGTTLNDTGQAWTINEWANKVVLITAATGAGQIRKISSNTATELTIADAWTTIPDATSMYTICEKGFRLMHTTKNVACREGV